jgi:hypothetical protein
MGWLIRVFLVLFYSFGRYDQAKQDGTWVWSKFWLTMGFAALLCLLVTAPLLLIKMSSPYFVPVYVTTWVVALAAIVWFAIYAKRWKAGSRQ